MISLNQLVGATESVDVNGKTFEFSPINLRDIGIMQTWWCELPLVKCRDVLSKFGDLYNADGTAQMIQEAKEEYETRIRVMQGMEIDPAVIDKASNSINAEFVSIDGMTKLIQLSLVKKHPEVTEDDAANILGIEGYAAMQDIIDRISFGATDPDADLIDNDGEKKTASAG
jgi:hypothetical protein